MALVHRALTLEEFLTLPEEEPELEYFDGVVTQKVSPKAHHSRLQGTLVSWVNDFGEPRKLAVAFPELRVTFAGASFVPDVSVFRWERLPLDEHGELVQDFRLTPDIAVEILSPGQSLTSLVERCRWYVQHGASLAMLLVPRERAAHTFRPGEPDQRFAADGTVEFGPALPGFLLRLDELFGSLRFR